MKVGEYQQFHDVLDAKATLESWTTDTLGVDRPTAQALLHRFLFTRDDLERSIATLSGGEKSRLQLLRLVHEKVNFLLLDEPTNHLDIEACEQLEEMLSEFDGTLLVISHDRYFLDKLVDRVVEVKDRGLVDHRVRFAEWWQRKEAAGGRARRGALEDREATTADKDAARRAHEERQATRREVNRLRNRHRELEQMIERSESRIEATEREIETVYAPGGDAARGDALLAEVNSLKTELEALYAEWERIGTQLGA